MEHSKRRGWIFPGACLASLALGVGVGRLTVVGELGQGRASTAALKAQSGPLGGQGVPVSRSPTTSSPQPRGNPQKTWLQSYAQFSNCRDSLKRQQLLAEALAGINESNWESAWAPMWKSRKSGEITEGEWKLFMQKFGMVGRARLAEKGRPANIVTGWEAWNVRHGIVGWATQDVGGSWDWISKLPEGNYRKGLMTGWFEGAATVDPDRALSALAQFDPVKDRDIWNSVAAKMARHDPEDVRPWLDALSAQPAKAPDPTNPSPTGWVDGIHLNGSSSGDQLAQQFFSVMLDQKMALNGDPAYAPTLKQWFDGFYKSPALPDNAMARVAGALQRSQPAAEVLEWIERHGISSGVFNASANTVDRWTNEQTADDVAAWLQSHRDSPAYDGAAAGFAVKAHDFDPEGAMQWANTIKDERERQNLLKSWEEK